jgi:hypothetical protein
MTFIEAIAKLYNHSDRSKSISFKLISSDDSEDVVVRKYWCTNDRFWKYNFQYQGQPNDWMIYSEHGIMQNVCLFIGGRHSMLGTTYEVESSLIMEDM